MNRTLSLGIAFLAVCALFVGSRQGSAQATPAAKSATAELKPSKNAATMPANKNVTGTVTFTEVAGGKVKVSAHVMGLAPNTEHGFHIHERGDLSDPGLMSTGGHFNPAGHIHGGPTTSPVHAGDLGNIKADATGMAMLDLTVEGLSIGTGAANDIVGKAVIVHRDPDDLKTQPAGNAGPRVSGGLIELKK
jgi:Cu-Zn family superoxide dismutase